jgi:hypothetical protein
MTAKTRIGVIGNDGFREQLLQALAAADRDQLEFHFRWYRHQDEAVTLTRELQSVADALFFSGAVPYYIAEAAGLIDRPATFVSHDEISLLKGFFELQQAGVDVSAISIDSVPESIIKSVCAELQIPTDGLRWKPLDGSKINEDFVQFHIGNFELGVTRFALTCRSLVYDQLLARGIPCHYMFWTKRTVLDALDRLVNSYLQDRYRGSQIAIGLIRARMLPFDGTLSHSRRLQLDLQRHLFSYADKLKVGLLELGDGLHLFYTTYGALLGTTASFRHLPELGELSTAGVSANIGIGTGQSAVLAENGARHALAHAERRGPGAAYALLEGRDLVGPIGDDRGARLVRVDDTRLQRLADRIGVATTSLARLVELSEREPLTVVSAEYLAESIGTSPRTARRLLNQLCEHDLARVAGQEMPSGHGRPRRLYRLSLGAGASDHGGQVEGHD